MAGNNEKGAGQLPSIANDLLIGINEGTISLTERDKQTYRQTLVEMCKELDSSGGSNMNYIKVILDCTYACESHHIDTDFQGKGARDQVANILSCLDQVNTSLSETSVTSAEREEVSQCIVWRRGALLYAWCQTNISLQANKKPCVLDTAEGRNSFIKDMQLAVSLLSQVCIPQDFKDAQYANSASFDQGMKDLLSRGVLSSTHLLSLMYCGELCSWLVENSAPDLNFSAVTLGREALLSFCEFANGPLTDQGWNTETAERLLNSVFKQAS